MSKGMSAHYQGAGAAKMDASAGKRWKAKGMLENTVGASGDSQGRAVLCGIKQQWGAGMHHQLSGDNKGVLFVFKTGKTWRGRAWGGTLARVSSAGI